MTTFHKKLIVGVTVTVLLLTYASLPAFAERKWTFPGIVIDTLWLHGDSAYARVTEFKNDTLTKDYTAFLVRECHLMSRQFMLPFIRIKRRYPVQRIILHGSFDECKKDGWSKTSTYTWGVEKNAAYYDSSGHAVEKEIYDERYRFRGLICGTPGGYSMMLYGKAKPCK